MSGWITLKMQFATTLCEEEMELEIPARTAESAIRVLARYEKSPWKQGENGWVLQRDVVVNVQNIPITIPLGMREQNGSLVLALREKETTLHIYKERQTQAQTAVSQLPQLIGSLLKTEADLIAYDVLREYYDRQKIPVALNTRDFCSSRLRLTGDERQSLQYESICA